VITTVSRLALTSSITERQLVLNSPADIIFIKAVTMVIIPWSKWNKWLLSIASIRALGFRKTRQEFNFPPCAQNATRMGHPPRSFLILSRLNAGFRLEVLSNTPAKRQRRCGY